MEQIRRVNQRRMTRVSNSKGGHIEVECRLHDGTAAGCGAAEEEDALATVFLNLASPIL